MPAINVDAKDLEASLRALYGKIADEAIPPAKNSAMLRTSRSALSRWVRSAAKLAGVKAKLIRARSSNRKIGEFARRLSVNTASIPVAVMGPKGKPPKPRNGIRVMGRHWPKGFIAKPKRGRLPQTAFQREGDKRGPLDELRVPIAAPVKATAIINCREAFEERFQGEFEHNFFRQVARIERRIDARFKSNVQRALR